MSIWQTVLQILVFFVVLKVVQVLVWNMRRSFYIHPWLVELIVGIVAVLLIGTMSGGWWRVTLLALLFGVVRGDQEEDVRKQRQLY